MTKFYFLRNVVAIAICLAGLFNANNALAQTSPNILVDFSTLDNASNSATQQGWKVSGIMSEIAEAKYLVLETEDGDYPDGFSGTQFIFQGNDGDPATIEVGWTQRNLNGDWVSFPRAEGKTVSILIDLKNVFGDKYDNFIQCTYWARILIGNYSIKPTAFENIGLTKAYLIDDFAKPADAVDLSSDYGFIIEGSVTGGSGVNIITTAAALQSASVIGYYTLTGQRLPQAPEKGIYIIMYDNGKSEKVVQ